MKDIYADKKIDLYRGDFEKPSKPLSVEIDCDKFDALQRKKFYESVDDF